MKQSFLLTGILIFVLNSNAQNPQIQPKNRLPGNPTLTIKKDTNATRFAVSFNEFVSGAGVGEVPFTNRYNLNTSNISSGSNYITINKTGLYHFDLIIHLGSISSKEPSFSTYLTGIYPSSGFSLLKDEIIRKSEAGTYKGNWHFSMDVQITAPATLQLRRYVINATSGAVMEGNLLGHLISE